MPLKTGTCEACDAENEKLRPHPFHKASDLRTCEACRDTNPDYAIIGVTDIKQRFKLKEEDLHGLDMATEPKPAFLGGADRRWYKLSEVEKRAEKVLEERMEKLEKGKAEKEEKRKEALEKKNKGSKGKKDDTKKKASKKVGTKEGGEAEKAAPAKRKRVVEEDESEAESHGVDGEATVEEPKKKRGRPAKAAKKEAPSRTAPAGVSGRKSAKPN